MTKRDEYLLAIKADGEKWGYLRNETKEAHRNANVSQLSISNALGKGQHIREQRYEKSGFYKAQDRNCTAREKIRRHMSCGDRLDTKEGLMLLKELHDSHDEYKGIMRELGG